MTLTHSLLVSLATILLLWVALSAPAFAQDVPTAGPAGTGQDNDTGACGLPIDPAVATLPPMRDAR